MDFQQPFDSVWYRIAKTSERWPPALPRFFIRTKNKGPMFRVSLLGVLVAGAPVHEDSDNPAG
ncbi:hypothetical protein DIE23_12060 [Burkholderia sp. Bp9143]|uniref:hypothetical protein n=1 Tax=Burkholderia sp. Bp9143 TaxID=2184574 RepID=UPI000F595DC2|nr:hypothetical protein [Burkholderia sp. Bp9143]RQR34357.1 hypothetical protein DIE23_12060 [Burkholderia sp. Bp9143]